MKKKFKIPMKRGNGKSLIVTKKGLSIILK